MRIALFFNLVFSTLVVVLAGAASLGIPIKYVAWPALAVTVTLSLTGVRRILAGRRKAALIAGAIVMAAVVVFCVGLRALKGCFPSDNPDCWAYAAFGQYLNDFSRGTHGGLSYVDEFAQVLSNARFGAATLLAFVSQVLGTNTARALVIFDVIVLVNCFLGGFCVTRLFGANSITSLASAAFFVCNGWMVRAVREGQLDNLIFLSLSAFVLARTLLLLRNVSSSRALIGLGANVAAACYCYPEGTAITTSFVGLPFGLAIVFWLLRGYRRWMKVAFVIAFSVLLVAPYIPTFTMFILNQLASTSGPVRPGEGMYPGLTADRLFPAVFGLGEEMSKIRIERWRLILPALLSLLVMLGVRGTRFRRASAASLCLLAAAVGFELVHLHYDYAAYKFIFSGILIWVPMIFVGASWLSRRLDKHTPIRNVATLGIAIVLLGGSFAQRALSPSTAPFHDGGITSARRIRKYEDIKGLQRLIGDSTLSIACTDPFKYLWAYYFARDLSIELLDVRSYFRNSPEILTNSRRPTGPLRFVLSDEPDRGAVWTNGQFWLFRVIDQPRIALSQSENTLEMLDGQVFTWIGNRPTTFDIIAANKGKIRFSCTDVIDGPSLPEKVGRSLSVSINGQTEIIKEQDLYALDLAVNRGVTHLSIACLDRPTRIRQENGDTRIMLVGLKGFRISRLTEE